MESKNHFAREGGRFTHGSLFSGISQAVLTLQRSGWDGRMSFTVNGTSSGKKY
jgi:hypothetical protein